MNKLFRNINFYVSIIKSEKFSFSISLGVLFLSSLLNLSIPFLTKQIVDKGISNNDLGFIKIILIGQIMIFIGQAILFGLKNWLLGKMGAKITLKITTNFMIKLMNMPLKFLHLHSNGEILQKIQDTRRIEYFLTGNLINFIFLTLNFIFYGITMISFNINIFYIFFVGSILSVGWIFIFTKKRKTMDLELFKYSSLNQSKTIQNFRGLIDIKLYGAEKIRLNEWSKTYQDFFNLRIKSILLNQYQQSGMIMFSQIKNIIINYIAATAVVSGEITLGTMLAITYIIGQLSVPIEQLAGFIQTAQDAQLSIDRIQISNEYIEKDIRNQNIHSIRRGDINIRNVSFSYLDGNNKFILRNINCHIRFGKTTAIVGSSGSGKSTLLKILLKFYEPTSGSIYLENTDFNKISNNEWRNNTSAIIQNGYIFKNSIAYNIALGFDSIDNNKLSLAINIAQLDDYIKNLPNGYNTIIDEEILTVSQGQKQKILIARAVYKNPQYFFLDEATNALDSVNEELIMKNLREYFYDRSIIFVAHRLSSIKFADEILLLENGEIVERGTHQYLLKLRSRYYDLLKSQIYGK